MTTYTVTVTAEVTHAEAGHLLTTAQSRALLAGDERPIKTVPDALAWLIRGGAFTSGVIVGKVEVTDHAAVAADTARFMEWWGILTRVMAEREFGAIGWGEAREMYALGLEPHNAAHVLGVRRGYLTGDEPVPPIIKTA